MCTGQSWIRSYVLISSIVSFSLQCYTQAKHRQPRRHNNLVTRRWTIEGSRLEILLCEHIQSKAFWGAGWRTWSPTVKSRSSAGADTSQCLQTTCGSLQLLISIQDTGNANNGKIKLSSNSTQYEEDQEQNGSAFWPKVWKTSNNLTNKEKKLSNSEPL